MRLLICLVVSAASMQAADEFCAATVKVTARSGAPALATANLVDSSGHVIASRPVANGFVEFCDFGFGSHNIQIDGKCGAVTITDVRLDYGVSRHYSAIYECPLPERNVSGLLLDDVPLPIAFTPEGYPVRACSVYLRISSKGGSAVPHAKVDGGSPPLPNLVFSDSFGRAYLVVPTNSIGKITVGAEGYDSLSFDLNCGSVRDSIQRAIVLRKSE